ncbi:Sugar transporter [Popillia japonica]|uniref:Sugar transporter n=1 Tax=Popillia japonica TaxID=7064 RepID=A0AAW1ITU7_POPJA
MTNTRGLLPETKLPDLLLATIGDFGRWQCRTSMLMALLKFPIAWFQLGIVFLAPPTEFWCRQPQDFNHLSVLEWKQLIKPVNTEPPFTSPCFMKNIEYKGNLQNRTISCRWGYEYDKSVMRTSIISEWNFVCGREFYADLIQITFMAGVLFGSFIFGLLADNYGRKRILIICIILQFIFGIASAVSPMYYIFLSSRFLLALANGGTVIISFVLCMEVVSGKWRTIIPILYQIPFGIGNTIMATLAYFIKEWRELQLVLSSLSAVFLIYIWFLPESPRWLVATGRKDKAVKTLEKALRINRVQGKNIADILENYTTNDRKVTPKFLTVFKTPALRKRTFFLALQWLLTGIIFHAFMQYVGQIGKNLFLNVSLGGLTAIPAAILCIFIVQKVGRKLAIACSQLITSLCLIIIYFIPLNTFFWDWPRIMFAGAIILTLSISTSTLFLFTGELYPTIIRNAGVGSSVVFFKVGAIIAPLVLSLLTIANYLPLLIMSVLALLQAFVIYPLPESKDCQLPDTITDIEMKAFKNAESSKKNAAQQEKLCVGAEDDNCNIIK